MSTCPVISVVLPVYNAGKYVKEAVESILGQTYTDFELLIYNDGSTDNSGEIIAGFRDKRIRFFDLETNTGLISVLNRGIEDAKGRYIARMDADDISLEERFAKQFEFLEKNPEYGICGTQIEVIGSGAKIIRPCTDEKLRWWLFRGSPFAHPTVMMRTSVLREHGLLYRKEYYLAEDYDMWWRMAACCKVANLDEVLLRYRMHAEQESSAKAEKQKESFNKGLQAFLKNLGLSINYYSSFLDLMFSKSIVASIQNIRKADYFFKELEQSQNAISFFGSDSIRKTKVEILTYCIGSISNYNPFKLRFFFSKLYINYKKDKGLLESLKTILKCLIFWKA